MKKVLLTIRKHLLLLGVVAFASFAVYSCSNEEENAQEPNMPDYLTNIKVWLDKNYSDAAPILEWGRAVKQQVEGLTIVEVPLVCLPGEYGTNDPSLLEGLEEHYWDHPVRVEFVINSKNEVTSALIYSVVPTIAYMEQYNFTYNEMSRTQSENLDGVIYTFGLDNMLLKVDHYENGSLTKSYLASSEERLDKEGKGFAKRMTAYNPCQWCSYCQDWGHYDYDCPRYDDPICSYCGGRGHTADWCPSRYCSNCGEWGHSRSNCSSTEKLCPSGQHVAGTCYCTAP